MKDILYVDETLMVGDEVAELLMQFTLQLTRSGKADLIHVNALDGEGNGVTATFVLGSATSILVKSCRSELPEPDNSVAIKYVRAQLASDPSAMPLDDGPITPGSQWDFLI